MGWFCLWSQKNCFHQQNASYYNVKSTFEHLEKLLLVYYRLLLHIYFRPEVFKGKKYPTHGFYVISVFILYNTNNLSNQRISNQSTINVAMQSNSINRTSYKNIHPRSMLLAFWDISQDKFVFSICYFQMKYFTRS